MDQMHLPHTFYEPVQFKSQELKVKYQHWQLLAYFYKEEAWPLLSCADTHSRLSPKNQLYRRKDEVKLVLKIKMQALFF